MKTFVLTALMATLLAGLCAPVASASSVTLDLDNPSVSCYVRLLGYAEDEVNRLFANVYVDDLEYCDAEVRAYQQSFEGRCPEYWSGAWWSWDLRVESDCDVRFRN